MEVGGTLSMITFKVPPDLGAGPEGEALGLAEAEGEALGLAEAAGELAAGGVEAGGGAAWDLEAGGGAAVEEAGAGFAEVAGAEVVGELQPIKTIAKTKRITRKP